MSCFASCFATATRPSSAFLATLSNDTDVILGTPWLASLSPILWNIASLAMRFWRDDRTVNIMGVYQHSAPRSILTLPAMAPPPAQTSTELYHHQAPPHQLHRAHLAAAPGTSTTTCMKPGTPLSFSNGCTTTSRSNAFNTIYPRLRIFEQIRQAVQDMPALCFTTLFQNLVESLLCVGQFKNLCTLASMPQTATSNYATTPSQQA